jgi:hypothetical protein
MKARTAKTIFGASLLAAAMTAHAESYIAKIYGPPPGFTDMAVNGAGDNGVMAGSGLTDDGFEHAVYITPQGMKSLHPAGWEVSTVQDAWSSYYTGWGRAPSGVAHALFWIGGSAPADLHPGSPAIASWAYGGGGQLQVGSIENTNFQTIACSWSRTASSNKHLSAPGYENTEAYGTNGTVIVGKGVESITTNTHALMWRNFASSAENLTPAGYNEASATGVDGAQQVGYVSGPSTNSNRHAALWFGSAASFHDLNPNGVFTSTYIARVRNGLQVGTGVPVTTPGRTQAIAWHGVAGTWINLHARLPYPFNLWSSTATDIDNQGNIVGTITHPNGQLRRPVIWLRQ